MFRLHGIFNTYLFHPMLPPKIQSCLARFSFLRRTGSIYGIPYRGKSSEPDTGSRSSLPKAQSITSINSIQSRSLTPNDVSELDGYISEQSSTDEHLGARPRLRQQSEAVRDGSDIEWKYANQGINLLNLAIDESSAMSQGSLLDNAPFIRQLYLHSLIYLLRGLPSDLSSEEQLNILSALPFGAAQPTQMDIYAGSPTLPASEGSSPSPSFIHRTLAATIIHIFICLQYLLPYIKYLFALAYAYECEHKVLQTCVRRGVEMIDRLGQSGLRNSVAISEAGDGVVGKKVGQWSKWAMKSVVGGVYDGLGEGIGLLKDPQDIKLG